MHVDWRGDAALIGLLDEYFKAAQGADEPETMLKTWLANETPKIRKATNSRPESFSLGRLFRSRDLRRLERDHSAQSKPQASTAKPADGWMSTVEAADYLQRTQKTLSNWRSAGEGPPYSKRSNVVRYRKADLDEWLEGGMRMINPVAERNQ